MVSKRKPLKKIKDEVDYYDHQIEGIRKMFRMTSFMLCDEMGLGKTLSAFTVAAIAFELKEVDRLLIVAPGSLKVNWGDEMDERASFTWVVLTGTKPQREKQLANFDADVLIVNYEQLIPHWETINKMRFGIAIYDEGHAISNFKGFPVPADPMSKKERKNHNSQRAEASHRLDMPRHFVLTGSPMLNQVDELWSLLHRIAPRRFPNYYAFVNRYAVFGGYKNKQIVGVMHEAELHQVMEEYMIRRLKKDCLDLPGKLPTIHVRLEMDPHQQEVYDRAKKELIIENPTTGDLEPIANQMVKSGRLLQICTGLSSLGPDYPDISPKLDWTAEMCESLVKDGKSVVVFSQFRGIMKGLGTRLDKTKIHHFDLHGDVKMDLRKPMVSEWGAETKAGHPSALICSYKVAGTGLNMVAASYMIKTDLLYVPMLDRQAEDRLDRPGQTEPITIYQPYMKDSIEQRIEAIRRSKDSVFNSVITGDGSAWKAKLMAQAMEDDE